MSSENNQSELPNVFPIAVLLVLPILFLGVLCSNAHSEPDPCTIHTHIVHKTEYAIFQSGTEAKVFADKNNGDIGVSQDGQSFYVKYVQTWAEGDGEGCWGN